MARRHILLCRGLPASQFVVQLVLPFARSRLAAGQSRPLHHLHSSNMLVRNSQVGSHSHHEKLGMELCGLIQVLLSSLMGRTVDFAQVVESSFEGTLVSSIGPLRPRRWTLCTDAKAWTVAGVFRSMRARRKPRLFVRLARSEILSLCCFTGRLLCLRVVLKSTNLAAARSRVRLATPPESQMALVRFNYFSHVIILVVVNLCEWAQNVRGCHSYVQCKLFLCNSTES